MQDITENVDFIKLVKERVANIAIGPSTLRNQGTEGIIEAARRFLCELDLEKLHSITKDDSDKFDNWLNEQTDDLMENHFPIGARKNWGAARKAMNVFLESAFYNRFLEKEYDLHNLANKLEIPLDSKVVKKLRKDSRKKKISCSWDKLDKKQFTIIGLKSDDSEIYQKCAAKVAKQYGMHRIYLDLYYWRAEE